MNPYLRIDALQSRNHVPCARWAGRLRLLLPTLLALAAGPSIGPILFWFQGLPHAAEARAVEGLCLRLSLLVCAFCAFAGHSILIRGEDRAVLDPHPVAPGSLLALLAWRLARESGAFTLGILTLLLPLAREGHLHSAGLLALFVLEGWVCGLGLALVSPFLAVLAARGARLRALLEAVRGGQPRMQAALVYAPGISLAAGGLALLGALQGVPALDAALSPRTVLLALPPALGLALLVMAPGLAERAWYPATRVTTEIEAEWTRLGGTAETSEASNAYLEWGGRFLPTSLFRHFIRAARQAWRAERGWISASWALGALCFLLAWRDEPRQGQAFLAPLASLALLSTLAIRMEMRDPPGLGDAIGLRPLPCLVARALYVAMVGQAIILPTAAALLPRHGLSALGPLLALEAASLLLASVASASSPLRGRAFWILAPAALSLWILASRSLS